MSEGGGKVLRCSCKHAEQDRIYGKGLRWHNPTRKGAKAGGGVGTWRCSVCKMERGS